MKHAIPSLLTVGAASLFGSLSWSACGATMILHNFASGASDGAEPTGSLMLSGSKLYGMSYLGGSSDAGAIFSMNTDGTGYGLLHSFAGAAGDGSSPQGSLTLSGSKLYGMTTSAGSSNGGTLFSINTDGTGFSLLHTFAVGASDGRSPIGSITLVGSKLYGMTLYGGSSGQNGPGVIFSMNTDGTGYSLLHGFNADGSDGGNPGGSLTLSDSKFYGMTQTGGSDGSGTVFSMNTDGTGFSLLHSFAGGTGDGAYPIASLILVGSKLFGMTEFGGGSGEFAGVSGNGSIFCVNTDGTGFSLLHSFSGGPTDGANPLGSLTLVGATLYGMTNAGGSSDQGTLFSINTDGTGFSLLENFTGSPDDGARPVYAEVTLSGDGSTLYGTTARGGAYGEGVVFSRSLVPEPGTFALLGLGTLLLAARRRNAQT